MSGDAMTERMVRAIEHPLVDAIGHPTGRLIGKRRGYAVDVARADRGRGADRDAAGDQRRARPPRPDELHARAACAAGVKIVLDSDAHRPATLANQRWAVATARRAWLTADDVANTRSWDELRALRRAVAPSGAAASAQAKRTRTVRTTEPGARRARYVRDCVELQRVAALRRAAAAAAAPSAR